MKRIGLAVLMTALAPVAYAAGGYTEVWNPPEARATAPHRVGAAHKLAVQRHVAPHAVKVHARRAPMSSVKLVVKQSHIQQAVPTAEPEMLEIPRQLTPEGNILRVDSRSISAEVTR
ncbi:hypothetical protein R69927_01039 [Paraburkholderia domus]|uniref:DUF4148 domain-containing protein n=1 Tax=Paraburkholderia domus TaxID=2793075 RepID=A0A9N8N115_9BURK|nr:hypothetical protein R70006_01967 [Paraburkholderia domus]CAE6763527.1 hypothetical protein R75483_03673 [Paraburkholderia domus]CAE6829387.1 hypothetical protein R69927_01039 [Paraburkholderia domus]CAE6860626.1 hypothetical protein R70199_00851 [Paraburkholderia domus]CAE6898043.1 hypothetical protein R75471_02790 [Paraburkholderia domus]